jgi:hypothetical protein
MFQGNSCYPISPSESAKINSSSKNIYIDDDDQMFKICERMNLDVENDLSHLTNTHHIKYMKTIFS